MSLRHWWRTRTGKAAAQHRRHLPLDPDVVDPDDDGESAARVRRALIADLLIELAPRADQPVLRAYYRDGLTREMIGKTLGIKSRWIGRRLLDGLDAIRSRLAEVELPEGLVPHPDWPGYAADAEGNIWSTRTRIPHLIQGCRGPRRKACLKLLVGGRPRNCPIEQFLASHPLHLHRRGESPIVPHPDWPGYGADAEGNLWSLRMRTPRKLRANRSDPRRRPYIRVLVRGSDVNVTVEAFLATHPLHNLGQES